MGGSLQGIVQRFLTTADDRTNPFRKLYAISTECVKFTQMLFPYPKFGQEIAFGYFL